jgi:hypothetical protein
VSAVDDDPGTSIATAAKANEPREGAPDAG